MALGEAFVTGAEGRFDGGWKARNTFEREWNGMQTQLDEKGYAKCRNEYGFAGRVAKGHRRVLARDIRGGSFE